MVRLSLSGVAIALAALAGLVGYRASTFTATPPPSAVQIPELSSYAIDAEAAASRLAEAIRFRTVTIVGDDGEPAEFERFQAWMQARYPAFHAAAKRERIGGRALLYEWRGSDPGLPPMLLLAHQDVVPAPEDTRAAWDVDPFAGIIRDGAVWGRGAIDDEGSLVGLLEAAEYLAASGAAPKRTILFAFGHDEEFGGEGAISIAASLAQLHRRAWFVLDEGMAAIDNHPLTGKPASLIGIAEKGFATLRVRAVAQPGHSSMPPPETAVSSLAVAVTRIHSMPIERGLDGGPALPMMRALAADISLMNRVAISNEWLFRPLLRQRMAGSPVALALLGTTVAPTMINGGVRPNVLPAEAIAMINFRIHQRDTAESLMRRARNAVSGLEGITLDWAAPPNEASPISSTTSSSYALIAALSRASLPDAPVAPGLVVGGTDARHYSEVAENVYRFQPLLLNTEDMAGIHGVNEHVSIENFERMIRFYIGLMQAGAM